MGGKPFRKPFRRAPLRHLEGRLHNLSNSIVKELAASGPFALQVATMLAGRRIKPPAAELPRPED
jgi:hypothetical protein